MRVDVPGEKPISNGDIINLLILIHRLIQKVGTFVSITRPISSLQRYVHERMNSNQGSPVLDVKVRSNLQRCSVLLL